MRISCFCILLLCCISGRPQNGRTALLNYVGQLARSDGGYGWQDQPDSHLTPTFAVIGIYNALGFIPANSGKLAEFVHTHHPQRNKNIEAGPSGTEERDLVYQQIQAIAWLKGDLASFKPEVLGWKPQFNKVSNFEEHGYPVFLQEMMTPVCRGLLKLPLEDISEHFANYIGERRRTNGSFNNVPVTDGGDGNIINTFWGLYGLHLLTNEYGMEAETARWIRNCQSKSGGFSHQPNAALGAIDDVAYTWAAVQSLQWLKTDLADKAACIKYLLTLRNNDGGFGRQPGLPSDPMASYYAISALKTLQALPSLDKAGIVVRTRKPIEDLNGFQVYTVQFEASGSGSPREAVMLADSLHIHLWGTKNATEAWQQKAQEIARQKKVPVIFFQSDEAYGKSVTVEGQGKFTHIMDFVSPPGVFSSGQLDGSSWKRYQESFINPLVKNNGALLLQVTNNEPLGRIILDESLKSGGFAAISAMHFGQNFSFWLPWLHQYRNQLPFVALQDAHGTESWWWADELAGYRTLFLAKDASYESLMDAFRANRVVAVRHDSVSGFRTRYLGGAPGVQAIVRNREQNWKWWKDDGGEPVRPMAAITVVGASDSFEVARPGAGVNIRVRCRWYGVRQLLRAPMVALEILKVNDEELTTAYKEVKNAAGVVMDAYYIGHIEKLMSGKHSIEAVFKDLRTNKRFIMKQEFSH